MGAVLAMKRELLPLLEERARRVSKAACEAELAAFVREAWPLLEPGTELRWNWHLDVICAYLEAYHERRIRHLILNVPPGSMKSLLVSVLAPAWAWTRWPERRFINLTNEIGLATRDSLRMRQVVQSPWYQERWGERVRILGEQREKTHFANQRGGFRQGLGFSGNITGKRGTDLLLDDPLDAAKAFSDLEVQGVNRTYDQAVSSRLNDPAHDGIVLIMQRLRTNDLTGHLLGKSHQQWVRVAIPMEYEGAPGYDPVRDLGTDRYHGRSLIDPRTRDGELMFPARFTPAVVRALKEDLGEYGTAGQLQQRPNPLAGGILRADWWRVWDAQRGALPPMQHVFASWDTAFSESDLRAAAYTACTTWGVFWDDANERHALMLLRAWWGRVGYPELREKAREYSRDEGLALDAHLIERKASGQSLIQDLRRDRRIRIRGYDPRPDGDKVARAYLVSSTLQSGLVYIPDREWARKVVGYVAEFPAGGPPCADLTDTLTQALAYLKRRWWITHPDDEEAPEAPMARGNGDDDDDGQGNGRRAAYG